MEKLCGDMIRMTLLPGFTPAKAVNFVERIRNSGDLFTPASGGAEKMVEEILFSAEKSALSLATKRYEKEIEYIAKNGIKTVSIFDEAYPASLREIYDPPLVLYFKGDLAVEDVDAVGVVGARHASEYGLRMAEEISAGLCNAGVTVVSGMAKGIDTAAHRGAIKSFGRTIAVMGSGFANLYPDDAQEMVLRIAENGAVLTENSSDILPLKWNFPRRNRIISGLSKGIVVVEAAKDSGSLITAEFALEQGKEVFAVPGRIDTHMSDGTNHLIQQGAKLVTRAEDILEELNLEYGESPGRKTAKKTVNMEKIKKGLSPDQVKIVDRLASEEAVHINDLCDATGIDMPLLNKELLRLEINRLIRFVPGQCFALRDQNEMNI